MKRARSTNSPGGAASSAGIPRRLELVLALAGCLLFAQPARAVILIGTGDSTANTTAPVGGLAGSGWDLQGAWRSVLGTPIAPSYFITAKHVGGTVGELFHFGGTSYTTVAKYDSPDSDLRIWKVDGTFSSYAPLYTDDYSFNQGIVMFGRGRQRGAELTVESELKGWSWGTADHVQRWGQNNLSDLLNGGASLGPLLYAEFNYEAGGNEAMVSEGDSGGGVFILDEGVWKLAAINYGLFTFSLTSGGPALNAAVFDAGGLYFGGDLIPNEASNIPGGSLLTPIAYHQDWIASVVPEPGEYGLAAALLLGVWVVIRRRVPITA